MRYICVLFRCMYLIYLLANVYVMNKIQFGVLFVSGSYCLCFFSTLPLVGCFARVNTHAMYFILIAGVSMIGSCIEVFCWSLAAVRQTHRIRSQFFSSILKQHIGWFDANQAGQMTSRLAEYGQVKLIIFLSWQYNKVLFRC